MRKLITLFAIAFLIMIPLSRVKAAVPQLSIRLSQPKTPTNLTPIPLIFVALDLTNDPVTVKCLKQGPGDLSFTQFGSDIALAATGNTGTCDVTSSILTTTGTYSFKAQATAGSDTAESEIISLNFSTSGPGDPTDYSKNHISSCQYNIHFKAADDGGKTVKVEVYRSEQTSFAADSGSRVTTISVSSNETRDYVDNVTCDKTYYYAIRAFDAFGNGSGVVGDSIANITYTTTTTTTTTGTTTTSTVVTTGQGAVEVPGGAGLTEEGAAAEEGSTLGEATPSGETTPEAEHITLPGPGQVKGSKTSIFRTPLFTGSAILFGIAIIIWYALRKKTQKK